MRASRFFSLGIRTAAGHEGMELAIIALALPLVVIALRCISNEVATTKLAERRAANAELDGRDIGDD
jgi:hypothetical protein